MMLRAETISKQYFRKTGEANYFYEVKPLSLTLSPGTVTVLCGRSGSGKTTLLHMLSGLLTPTEGKVFLDDTDLYSLSDRELSQVRNRSIGVIPQGRSVIETLSVIENILLPGGLYQREDRREAAFSWMDTLEIHHLEHAKPSELSGGELRRVAIARTMTGNPEIILADEPTGDLDDENTERVFKLFRAAAEKGAAVFIVTHEMDAMQIADKAYRMDGGEMKELPLPEKTRK